MSGKINPGIPIVMAGFGDLVFAILFWLFMADGEMIFNIVFGVLLLIGVVTIGVGMLITVRNT